MFIILLTIIYIESPSLPSRINQNLPPELHGFGISQPDYPRLIYAVQMLVFKTFVITELVKT